MEIRRGELDRLVDRWVQGPGEKFSELHTRLLEHLAPDPEDNEADSDAWHAACSAIEAAIFELPCSELNLRRIEGWRKEFGGGWDASWRMLLGPFSSMLPEGRVAELRAEALRTFDREFLATWGLWDEEGFVGPGHAGREGA